jgi:hypothetical protein
VAEEEGEDGGVACRLMADEVWRRLVGEKAALDARVRRSTAIAW